MDKNVGGINEVTQSLINEFKSIAKEMRETGEDMGEELMKGVSQGIKKHSKEVKSETAKLFEDFNRKTNNFKSRKSVTAAEWTSVLNLSKELMKSERYADSVKEKLSGISVTFKGGVNVSGLEKVLVELEKAESLVESVSWSEAGKNYRKKPSTKKTSTKKPKVETPVVDVDLAPEVKKEAKSIEELEQRYHSLIQAVQEWKKLSEDVKSIKKSENAADLRKQVLALVSQVSPDAAHIIGPGFENVWSRGFKNARTKDILAYISWIDNADLLGDVTQQLNVLNNIDLKNFNLSEILSLHDSSRTSSTWQLREFYDILKQIAQLQGQVDSPVKETTDAIEAQGKAAEKTAQAQEKYNKRMSEIKDKYNKDISDQKQLVKNQQDWIEYLNGSLDQSRYKSTGKKDATDKLRAKTNYMQAMEAKNYAGAYGEYPREMAEVAWMYAYKEAERQGVAKSVLHRYDSHAKHNFDKNLQTLQEQYEFREKRLNEASAELERLYLERNKEGFAAFADKLMPDGPQSDEEKRILTEMTEQVAKKVLDYTDAKASLEKSIMTLRNMASSEVKVNLQNMVDDLKKTYDTETFDKVFGADFGMFPSFDKIDDAGAKELYDMLIESNQKYQASLKDTIQVKERDTAATNGQTQAQEQLAQAQKQTALTSEEINHALDVKARYTGANLQGKSDFINAIKHEWERGNKAVSAKLFDQYKVRFPDGTYDPSTDKKFGSDWSDNYSTYLEQANRHLAEMDKRLEGITAGVIETQGEFKTLGEVVAESRKATLSDVDLNQGKFYDSANNYNFADAEAQLDAARKKAEELEDEALAAKQAFDKVNKIKSDYFGESLKQHGKWDNKTKSNWSAGKKSEWQTAIKSAWAQDKKQLAAKLYEQYQMHFPKGTFDPSKLKMFGSDWADNYEKYLEQANRHIIELDTIMNGMAKSYGKYDAYDSLQRFVNSNQKILDNKKQEKLIQDAVENDFSARKEAAQNKYATDDATVAQENLNKALDEYNRLQTEANEYLKKRHEMQKIMQSDTVDAREHPLFAGYEAPIQPYMKMHSAFVDADQNADLFAVTELQEAIRVAKELGIEIDENVAMIAKLRDKNGTKKLDDGRVVSGDLHLEEFYTTFDDKEKHARAYILAQQTKLVKEAEKTDNLENSQQAFDAKIAQQNEYQQELEETADAIEQVGKAESNILYHAGDLSNPSKTQKTYPLGHVRPSKSYGVFNGFTGLYTTEDVDGFWGNEWDGAPISTIDASQYKLFDARTDELATKAKEFFDSLNGTIYGYIEDFATGEIEKITDVKSIDELWVNFQEVFKNTNMTFEKFSEFVKKAQGLVNGKNFSYIEGLPHLDEGIVKTGDSSVLQDVSKEVFDSDSFQTQLLKMLGFEGIDLRGTKYNGTYTGGTVLFDVKPESINTVNEKWSDVMTSHGYEIDESALQREEKRRQLAFDTAKAYSQQADAVKEVAAQNNQKSTNDLLNDLMVSQEEAWQKKLEQERAAKLQAQKEAEEANARADMMVLQREGKAKGQAYSGNVYHGSGEQLNDVTFDPTIGDGLRRFGLGAYFTEELDKAAQFGDNIVKKSVDLKNVFMLTEDMVSDLDDLYAAMGKVKPENVDYKTAMDELSSYLLDMNNIEPFTNRMKRIGYDGMFAQDGKSKELVVYDEKYYQNWTTATEEQLKVEQQITAEKQKQNELIAIQKTEVIGYHGTTKGGFAEFDPSKRLSGQAVFFSSSRDVASTYADGSTKNVDLTSGDQNQKAIYTGKISANNVVVVDANGSSWRDLQQTSINGEPIPSANGGKLRYRLNASQITPLIIENGVLRGEGPKQTEYGWADTPDGPLGSFVQINGQKKIDLSGTVEQVRQAMIDGGLNEDVADFLLWRSNNDIAANRSAFESGAPVSTTQRDLARGVGYNTDLNTLAPFTTDELAEWLFYKGADMVQFDNIRDTGPGVHGNIDDVPLSSVYAIRDAYQIEIIDPATLEMAQKSNEQLIASENRYQQELEESARINKERQDQLDAYAGAASTFLSDSKYDSVLFDDKNKLFESFGNKIMKDGMLASDAMDQLYISMEKLVEKSKEMPDDVIAEFGSDSEKVADTVSQLQKLSSIDLTRIFGSVDLSSFLQSFHIDKENFATFRTLFEELMQITNAMVNGVDVGNAFDVKINEITDTIMRLGGYMADLDDGSYATAMQGFYKHMSGTVVQFNDAIKAEYTKDEWKDLYKAYKNRLTADPTKGIDVDSLYQELGDEEHWPSLFPSDVINEKDQFKLIFEKINEARQLQENNWKVLKGFTAGTRDSIQGDVDDMYNQMSGALFADSSKNALQGEADALKEVEQNATNAANEKGKFAKKNKELGEGAAASSDDLDDEAESLEDVNRAAANMPDVSAYDSTSVRLDANGNPYSISGSARMEMLDGSHVRTTDQYSFNADSNRWEYDGSVQSTERTREMVQALEEYYKILNRIQKLRLDTSGAVHTEEINKLETEDLARAYQRVCDLGIQVNDIEGQINLSVNQRRALLDVELRARQEMYDVIAKMEDKQATESVKPYQKTARDEIKKSADIDTNIRLLGDNGASSKLQDQVAEYRRLVDELVDLRLQLARNTELANDVDFSNRFAETAKRAQNARVAIEGVFKESQKLQKIGNFITAGTEDVSKVENLKTAMIEFANSALDGEVKINGFNKEGTEMYVTFNNGADAVQNITVALDKATGHLQAFSTGTDKATNEWEDFKTKAVDGAKNIIGMYVGFQEGVQAVRTGVEYVKEIDLAMTELKKVTDETDASYKQFLEDAGSTSAIIGSTIRDFTEASSTFARLGYTLEESSSMAETAIIYKNVADGLDTVEESSESIISTMMAFGIEANDTMSIIDRFNAVGNNFAITSAGIGDALQRSASALFAAGNTIDESIALVTAANSVIQNPEQVGTALKTLSLRIRGVKTELEEAGLETEGMAENTAKLQEKLLALTHGKVDIMLDPDSFKSTTQILREMSVAWEDMTDIERAAALELIGGKRQANILSSVITNFETVEDVIETSMNSSGSAMAENEKWLDSIEGKTYQFTNALQTMWSNMIDSEVIKGFLDFGTDAIQFLDTSAGKVIALVAALKLMAKFKGFSIQGIAQGLGDTINKITAAQQTLQTLGKTTPIGQGFDLTNVNAYAQAVANLTAKQQANLLASQGLNQEQIKYALTLNQVDNAAMREAMAHVHATSAKQQENAVTAQSIQQKAQELAMSLRTQAATADETRAKELNVVADILENATSEEAIQNNLQEAVTSGSVSAALQAETTNTLGLTTAKKGLLATTKALMVANPVGFWLTVGTTILSLIPIVSSLVDTFTKSAEEIKQEAKDISQTYSDAVSEINNNLKSLGITSDSSSITTLENEFATLAAGVDRYGNNISLTSDEYERYREICEQIVGINPQIASGYDSATEAIGNNAGVLSQLIELQKEQARFAAQEYVSDSNLDILSKDAVNDYKEAIKDSGNDILESKNELFSILNQGSNQSTMNHILQTLGYGANEISGIMSKYYMSDLNEYDSNLFINDFIDEIGANASKFGKYTNDINDFFGEYENVIASGEKSIEKAQDGLIDKLLIVPKSDEAYDQISSEGKNFLSDWIKNSDIFKVDESTTPEDVQGMRETILGMMDIIVSDAKNIEYKGEKFTAQDILGQIYDLDSSYVSFGTYKEQLTDLLEAFWNSLSKAQKEEYGFEDFEDFQISLGFDFVTDEETESKMISRYAEIKGITEDAARDYFDSLPAIEVQRLLQVDWNTVDESNVDETIQNTTKEIQDATSILSNLAATLDSIQSKYDTLQGAIDEFNERGAISGETLKSLIDNDLLQYLTFTEYGLIADANAMKMLEQAAINESYAMLNAAMVQDMENYALGKTEQMSALAQNAIGYVGNAAANAGAQAAQGAQGFLSFASAVAQAGIIDPGNLTAGLQQIYNAYQNIGNAIGHASAYRPSDAYTPSSGGGSGSGSSSNSAKEIDWIDHYYTEIENKIDELNARLENKISNVQALDAKNTIIDQIIDLYDQKQQKLANAVATYDARADYLFSTFSSDIQNKINNGSLDISSITDETLASNIEEYYDYIEAASQARVEAEELKQTIADLAKQKFDNISTAYENEIGLVDAYIDALQDQIDATEARGEQVGASYYEGMIDSAEKRKQSLEEERNALQASLDEAVKLGQIEVGSDTWYEMVNAIYEIDSAIVEADNSMEEWQTAINDLHWENFDKLISKLDGIASELDNIYERLTDNDEAFDENGNWTNQGIAALGMLTQKMEQAQFAAQQYADQIDQLNTDYAAGKYSEEEYNEKLAELTEGQWESIEAYESAKDEIVDLNKARVDAVKDGMQKELDAYKELIDAKKEALEADKEAHDWANSVAEKEKNILDIQRKLAALANDNSASANAQKKKLQADLLEAQAELEEAYYDKSIEDQQDALDQEYESYEENQQKEMDSLEEWLDDRETVIQDSFNLVKENAQVVYDELLDLSQEYGIQISDEIIAPWQAGKDAIGEYKDAFTSPELNAAVSEFMGQLDSMKSKWEETADAAEDAAQRQIDAVRRQQQETVAAYKEMQDSISTITIGNMNNVGHDDSDSGSGGGGGAGWGGGGLGGGLSGGTEEEVKPYSILEIFTNSLGKSYNKFLNDTAADFDYKMSEAFIQNADQYNQEFKLRVPEEYKQFLQLVCDGLNISSTEGVGIADSLSRVFALEDLPYHYKVFLANVVEGLVLAEEQGLEASGALSAIFASEDVPQNYKDFLDCIIGNLNNSITSGEQITNSTSAEFASNAIPLEYQNYLDSIMQGLQAPVIDGTQDANNTSADFFGSKLPEIINGVFADVETTAAGGASWASREMVRSTNNLWDNLVAWWNGVMNSLFGGGSSTHTSSSGSSHGGGGGTFVDGTANVNGTAYADGNWGAPKTETSLVGEIGPEILVRNGKWTTVGENGAEFTQVKKGDIIFNHKQSEQLLKHGHVTGRGKAYASGTTWKSVSNHLDDLGEELTMCAGPNGGLQFLSKGAAAMATGTIGNLTNLSQFDTTDILNRSRPSIGVSPSVANNTTEIKIDHSIGELIHVDNLNGNNLDEIGKFVDKAWEKKMQILNSSIKKYTR